MPLARKLFVALCLLLAPLSALAWIDTGHMVVASIAYRYLDPKVRAKCDALLRIGGDAKTQDFYGASCWADDTKTRDNGKWHYIDNYFRSDGRPAKNKPDAENVVWAIDKFSKVLSDTTASEADRADALRYLIHFVGDIHQPLHTVSRETDDMPDGDAGGNRIEIQPVPGIDMWHPNLHALWDFACGLYKSVPRPLTAEGKAQIDALAARIIRRYPPPSTTESDFLKVTHWMAESEKVAHTFVYKLRPGAAPSRSYLTRGQEICEQRLSMAGYRLAALLNKLLGS